MAKVYRRVCDIDPAKLADGDRVILRFHDGETDRHVKMDLCDTHKKDLGRRVEKFLNAGTSLYGPEKELQDEIQEQREYDRRVKDWLVEFGYYGGLRRGRVAQVNRDAYALWQSLGEPTAEIWFEIERMSQGNTAVWVAQAIAREDYDRVIDAARTRLDARQREAADQMLAARDAQPSAVELEFSPAWAPRPLSVERDF